jgi:glutaminyl-peptide cyclotransferase
MKQNDAKGNLRLRAGSFMPDFEHQDSCVNGTSTWSVVPTLKNSACHGQRCRRPTPALTLLLPFALLLGAACERAVPVEVPEVIRMLPHDPGAYTQGLVFHEGRFFESTGQYGRSTLREVDVETGEVLRQVNLSDEHFGEGLALVGDRLIQLTWKEQVAFVWDAATFELVEAFSYQGDGWGLCYDGEWLWMTSGGSLLFRRDPRTFALLDSRQIMQDGRSVWEVNELACVGDHIYGNVYMTDRIVKIEKSTGQVVTNIDASSLAPLGGRPPAGDAVLNGIAHDPATDTFYLTGKLWPTMFQVRFVPR